MLRQPEVYKCRFCDFKVPKAGVMVNSYDSSRVTMAVPVTGWSVLQRHCYENHGKEPEVKDLVYSDRELEMYEDIETQHLLKYVLRYGSVDAEVL